MSSFVHLNVHSHYSKGWGVATLEELCRSARKQGMRRLALTDTNGLYGLIFFLQTAKEAGLEPVVGSELVSGERRAVLLVKNRRGAAKAVLKGGEIDLTPLDEAVDAWVVKLLNTFPNCTRKTLESVRKHKLEHWDRNKETNRSWLGLNMMTEGRAGFRAFNEGSKQCREADFLLLRRRLAEGRVWDDELVEEVLAKAHGKEVASR